MQEKKKKKSTKKFREREREREREGEREGTFFFLVRENYAQNKRDSDKFIVRECE